MLQLESMLKTERERLARRIAAIDVLLSKDRLTFIDEPTQPKPEMVQTFMDEPARPKTILASLSKSAATSKSSPKKGKGHGMSEATKAKIRATQLANWKKKKRVKKA